MLLHVQNDHLIFSPFQPDKELAEFKGLDGQVVIFWLNKSPSKEEFCIKKIWWLFVDHPVYETSPNKQTDKQTVWTLTIFFQFGKEFREEPFVRFAIRVGHQNIHIPTGWLTPAVRPTALGNDTGG